MNLCVVAIFYVQLVNVPVQVCWDLSLYVIVCLQFQLPVPLV